MDIKKIKRIFDKIKLKCIFSKIKIPKIDIRSFLAVPNLLTFVRIILIIPFSLQMLNENYGKSLKILFLSGLTDILDGFFARLLKQETKFGKFFDPIADKLTLISIMVLMGIKFGKILPFIILLISKELLMLIVGAIMIKKYNNTIQAKWYGKLSTAFFYISIFTIISIKALWNIENEFFINVLMWMTSLLMLHALIRYGIDLVVMVRSMKQNIRY